MDTFIFDHLSLEQSFIKGMDTFLFEMSMKWMFTFKNFRNVYWHGKTHSALIFYMFPTSREHRNIVQICTTSHLKCGILILSGLRSATSKDLLTSKVYPVTYFWWGRWWSKSLQSFDKDYQETSSFSSCYMVAGCCKGAMSKSLLLLKGNFYSIRYKCVF